MYCTTGYSNGIETTWVLNLKPNYSGWNSSATCRREAVSDGLSSCTKRGGHLGILLHTTSPGETPQCLKTANVMHPMDSAVHFGTDDFLMASPLVAQCSTAIVNSPPPPTCGTGSRDYTLALVLKAMCMHLLELHTFTIFSNSPLDDHGCASKQINCWVSGEGVKPCIQCVYASVPSSFEASTPAVNAAPKCPS